MHKFTVVQKRSKSYNKPKHNFYEEKNYEEEYNEEKTKISKELKIIEKFVTKLCRNFVNELIKTERENKKYCFLFKYNDDPDNGEVFNDTIDGIDTKYILSGKWIPKARQYFPFNLVYL